MFEKNGVTFFPRGGDYRDHPAFVALRSVSLGDVRFPWGFFLVHENGKTYVSPATEQDHRRVLLQAFPDLPEEALSQSCRLVTTDEHLHCGGTCKAGPEYDCVRHVAGGNYYGCGCIIGI
jgi:hypothetical protein